MGIPTYTLHYTTDRTLQITITCQMKNDNRLLKHKLHDNILIEWNIYPLTILLKNIKIRIYGLIWQRKKTFKSNKWKTCIKLYMNMNDQKVKFNSLICCVLSDIPTTCNGSIFRCLLFIPRNLKKERGPTRGGDVGLCNTLTEPGRERGRGGSRRALSSEIRLQCQLDSVTQLRLRHGWKFI